MEKKKNRSEKKTDFSKTKVQESKPNQPLLIVGIGASAGGLEPTKEVLKNIPKDTGLSFVIIQHLMTGTESMLPDILSRSSNMPVEKVHDGVHIKPNHVYVIPPGKTMTIQDDILELLPKDGSRKPIDEFFKSLAASQKDKAIGVILSGTGTDGTEGLMAIKEEGGITIAQDPNTAQYMDMPQNAISANTIYMVLSTQEIAQELTKISKHIGIISQKEEIISTEKAQTAIQKIFTMLKAEFGVNFTHYKKGTIQRRIARRMVINKIENINQYAAYIKKKPRELEALFDDLLIGVTSFFREPKSFKLIKEIILPKLTSEKYKDKKLRVWIPGCSTGEEVYSTAITIVEYLENQDLSEATVQIFGTDANEKNIEKARRGIYPKIIEEQISRERLNKFFIKSNGDYQITKRIRDLCVFARHDLTKDPPFSGLDLIICRNLLIYFDAALQKRVLTLLHYGLNPEGYLVLGESESAGTYMNLFEQVNKKNPIFIKKQTQPRIDLPTEGFIPRTAPKIHGFLRQETDDLSVLKEKVENILMSSFVPATLLVNSSMDILDIRGQTSKYLSIEPGTPSFSITRLVRKEILPTVQSLIYRSGKEKKDLTETIFVQDNSMMQKVQITIKYLNLPSQKDPFFLLIFKEQQKHAKETEPAQKDADENGAYGFKDRRIRELTEALESSKQALRTSIENHEATNEELRSAMEELQSSNEELMSTNEELETAKEELQSTNEELSTINSELKERNSTLAELSDDLSNVLENVDAAIIILDRSLKIKRFTNPAQEFLRLIPSDVGRHIGDIRLDIAVEDLEKELSKVINDISKVRREIKTPKGNWFQLRIRPYLTEENKIEGAVLTIIDINDLKQAQEALKVSEERFSKAFNFSPVALSITKMEDGKFVDVNQSFLVMFEFSRELVMDKTSSELGLFGDSEETRKSIAESLEEKRSLHDLEFSFTVKSGKPVKYLFSAIKIEIKGEKCIIGAYVDITQRRSMEEKLKAYSENLEKLVKERTEQLKDAERLSAIGATAGMVGHDIRNPLQSVISELYLARDELDSLNDSAPKIAMLEGLKHIENDIEYINKIVNDLQDYARVYRPVLKTVNLCSMVEDIMCNDVPEQIETSCKIEKDAEEIFTDPDALKRILKNLVRNAVQAMENGGKLSINVHKDPKNFVIEVEDNGEGIAEENKPKIFSPLFTTKAKGQGFGLAVVKRLTQALGGDVTFESEVGKGTKFVLTLPSR